MNEGLSQRQRYLRRRTGLRNERNSWMPHWQELSEYIWPRKFRYLSNDRNKGTKRNDKIINSEATWAARALSSNMMQGITNPASPWFRLIVSDPELGDYGPVRSYLHHVEERMREVFARSNTYNALAVIYSDLVVAGTSVTIVEEDLEDVIRLYVLPLGQYCLANGSRLKVDTLYRDLGMTVAQIVDQFGLQACSPRVQELYRRGVYDDWVDVVHIIEPNRSADPKYADRRGMAWRSCWFEEQGDDSLPPLREGGYREFPVLAPRWHIAGEDVYGSESPAMNVLGDVRALQALEREKAKLVAKLAAPPMVAPSSLRNGQASLIPGAITYVDSVQGGQTFRAAIEINPIGIQVVEASISQHAARIQKAFHSDMLLNLSGSDRRSITAREVDEVHEEKALLLGPVLERAYDELLDPLIERAFAVMLRRGILPPAPQELQGQELKVELVSYLAQAQKLTNNVGIERVSAFVGSLASVKPEVLDNLDVDEMVGEYAKSIAVNPDILKSDDEVAAIRADRAKQQQAAQQGQAMAAAADGAKTLSETDLEGDSALNRLLSTVGGGGLAARGAA